MEKNFESIDQLVHDPYFVQKVTDLIEAQIKQRRDRPEAKPGYRYIRNWYDRMRDRHELHARYFIDEIEAIWLKRSSLSSEYRRIIDAVCTQALHETHEYYKSLPDPAAEPKPKRTRKKKVS